MARKKWEEVDLLSTGNEPQARRLRELMHDNGISKRELADATGISYSAIVTYCTGYRSPGKKAQEKLSDFFTVDVDYLMGRSNVKRVDDLLNADHEDLKTEKLSGLEKKLLKRFREADDLTKLMVERTLGIELPHEDGIDSEDIKDLYDILHKTEAD